MLWLLLLCRDPEGRRSPEMPGQPRVRKRAGIRNQAGGREQEGLVAGSGRAALEAARVAALRGHEVMLNEKAARPGGLVPIAAVVKDHEQQSLVDLLGYYSTQLAQLGVKVTLGQEVDAALATKLKPDVLILATGGRTALPDIPGSDHPKVIDSTVLQRRLKLALRVFGPKALGRLTKTYMPVGNEVVIIGGGVQGCQLAEFLVKRVGP